MTGATGFIGSHFLKNNRYCGDYKCTIDAIVKNREIRLIQGVDNIFYWDFTSPRGWIEFENQIAEHADRYDVFLHCASLVGNVPGATISDYYTVNVDATRRTLDFARAFEIPHYVYMSTGSVYGSGRGSFDARSPCNPIGAYATTKYMGELLCREYTGQGGCGDDGCPFFPHSMTILRVFHPYGNDMQSFRYIPSIFRKVKMEIPIEVDYPYPMAINPIHVDDVSIYIKEAIHKKCEGVQIVAGGDNINEVQMANWFGDIIGKTPVYKFRKYDGHDYGCIKDNEYIGCPDYMIESGKQTDIHVGLRDYAEKNR